MFLLKIIKAIANVFLKKLALTNIHLSLGENTSVNWLPLLGSKGELQIGDNSIVNCKISYDKPNALVEIGSRTYIGKSHLVCANNIFIGNDVIISWGVTILDHDSHSVYFDHRSTDVLDWSLKRKDWSHVNIEKVCIEDRAWIGFGCTILKGVTIGKSAVIAAQSVVIKDVPPNALVAGNPSRIIKYLE